MTTLIPCILNRINNTNAIRTSPIQFIQYISSQLSIFRKFNNLVTGSTDSGVDQLNSSICILYNV